MRNRGAIAWGVVIALFAGITTPVFALSGTTTPFTTTEQRTALEQTIQRALDEARVQASEAAADRTAPAPAPTPSDAAVPPAAAPATIARAATTPPVFTTAAVLPSPACTITFDGGASTLSWHAAANWDTNVIPATTDVVCIPASFNVSYTTGTSTVAALKVDGSLAVDSTLTVTDPSYAVALSVTGALTLNAALTITNTFTWPNGIVGGAGALVIDTGATATLGTGGTKNLSTTLANDGTVNWTGGFLQLRSDLGGVGHLDNRNALNVSSDASASWVAGATQALLSNSGTITKSGTGNVTFAGLDLTNTGTVNIAAGLLGLNANGADTIAGAWNGAAGTTLRFGAGSYTATGTVNVPTVELNGGNLATTNTATFTAGVVQLTSGTLTLDSPTADTHVGTLNVTGGSFDGSADVTVTVGFAWTDGVVRGSGTLTIPAAMTSAWSTGGTKNLSRHVINLGTIDWTGGFLQLRSDFGGVGHLDNRNALNISSDANASWVAGATQALLSNTGTITKSGPGNVTFAGLDLTNTGAVNIVAGLLGLNANGSDTIAGAWNGAAGTTLRFGSGNYTATGAINVPTVEFTGGNLTMDTAAAFTAGTVRLTSSGLTLNSPTADTHVGSLIVDGGTLGGTTDLTPTDAFSWIDGIISGSGTLTIPVGLTSAWSTGATKNLSRHVINLGTIDWTGGFLQLRSDLGGVGHLDNRTALNVSSGADASWVAGATQAMLSNSGTITKSGTGAVRLVGLDLTNTGTVNIAAGLFGLNANGSDTIAGSWNGAAGTTLRFGSGSHTATGTINVPTVELNGGNLTAGSTAAFTAGTAHASFGTLTLDSPTADTHLGTLIVDGGRFDGATNVTVTDGFSWIDGIVGGTGALIVPAGVTSAWSTGATKSLSRHVINLGTIDWTGGLLQLRSDLGGVASLDNRAQFNIAGGLGAAWVAGATMPVILNTSTGTIAKSGSAPSSLGGGINVTNEGTLALSGPLTLGQNTVLSSTARVEITLGNDVTGLLNVPGLVTLNGMLAITNDSGANDPDVVVVDGGTMTGTFSSVTGATVVYDAANARVLITPTVATITVADVTVDEQDEFADVVISLSSALPFDIQIAYSTVEGSATGGSDYESVGASATIPAFASSITVQIPITDDEDDETDETFTVLLSDEGTAPAVIGDAEATVTIVDDDTVSNLPPLVSVLPQSFNESADTMGIVVNGVGGDVPITLPIVFTGVTASSPADFNGTTISVTVQPNSTTTVFVSVEEDLLDEDDETFTASIGLNTATMTIVDNDELPIAVIDDAQVTEGDTGERNIDFTVHLIDPLGIGTPTPSGRMVQVTANTHDGTATEPDDYTATSQVITIPAGAISRPFSVPVIGDTAEEGGETFRVTLDQTANATVDDNEEAEGVIVDDDTPVGTGDIPSQLGAGGGAVIAALPGWGDEYDLDASAGFELPVVTDQLDSRLGVASRLGSFSNPLAALDSQLGAALDQIEAAGCTVDWVEGGIGGRPAPPTATDRMQVQCTTTLADLAEAAGFTGDELNDQMAHVLDGLASALGLDASLTVTGDLTVHLVMGVDTTGFYVGNASALTLAVDATGTVSGTAAIGGTSGLAITGTGVANLDVKLTADGGAARLRTADLANPGAFLRPSATGTATLGLNGALDPLTFQWGSTHTATVAANGTTTVATDATLDAALTLPGIALNLHGTFDGTTWLLHGVGEAATNYTLDGFTLDNLVADATITPSAFSGSFDAAAHVNPGTPITAALHATFSGATLHATAHVALADQTFGLTPALVYLDGFSLDVTLDADVDTQIAALTATVHADTLVLLPQAAAPGVVPNGAATATGVTGTVDGAGNVALHLDTLTGRIAGAIDFTLTDVDMTLGPNANGPLFTVVTTETTVATMPDLGDLQVTLTGFHLNRNGTFGATSVAVASTSIAETIGLGGILPFDLTSVGVVFPDHENLDAFNVTAVGSFDFPAMDALPFDPIIEVAGNDVTAGESFPITIAVDSFAGGAVRPLDFGPIKLGFSGLQVGTATIAADLTLGQYTNGVWVDDFGGSLTIGGIDVTAGSVTVGVGGSLDADTGALDLTGTFAISANLSPDVQISGAALGFALGVRFGTGFTITGPTLTDASIDRVAIRFGDFMTLVGTGGNLNLEPAPGVPLVQFDSLSVEFNSGASVLSGWTGTAGNFAIDADLTPRLLPGFFVSVEVPPGTHLGLPDFLPLHIDDLRIVFPNVDLANLPAGGTTLTDLAAFTFRISGGIDATAQWPISASVSGLELDLGKLASVPPEFPITNLSGFKVGVEPFELAPGFTIGGALELKTIDVDADAAPGAQTQQVFYGRVSGTFEYEGFGAGIDLVVSQYGPVLAQLKVPVGVPIDGGLLGGILLTSVTGGVNFGGAAFPDPQTPLDILHDPAFNTNFPVNDTTIRNSVQPAVQEHNLTWSNAFTVALSGALTHAAAPGVLNGQVTLGMNVGFGSTPKVKLIGSGDVNFYGMPFADAALLIDLGDPIAPRFDAAFETPSVGNPLSFLLPASAQFEVSLDTKGIVAGVAAGVRTFVTRVADGPLPTQALFNGALDALALRLQQDHANTLAQLLLDTSGDGAVSSAENARVITHAFIVDRLLGRNGQISLLALGANGLPANSAVATKTVQALLPDLFDAAGDALTSNQFGTTAAAAVASFADVLNQAVRDAGAAFLDQFDPKFILRGAIQPVIFGVPLGQPDQRVEVILAKDGLSFGFDTSMHDIAVRLSNLVFPVLGGAVTNLFSLGFADHLGVTVQLPITGVAQRLLTGQGLGATDFDPVHGDWSVELRGGLSWNGFDIGQMTGLLVAPGDSALLDAHVQKMWLDPNQAVIPTRIPIQVEQHYNDLLARGGLLLTGRLLAQRLLTDPVGLLSSLNLPFPTNPLLIPDWVAAVGQHLSVLDQPALVQLYIPGLAGTATPNFDATTELGRLGFTQTGQALANSLNSYFASAYIEGTWNGKMLSVPIGNGTMTTTHSGVQVQSRIPMLGLTSTFDLDMHPTPGTGGVVNLPRAATQTTLDSTQLNTALTNLGLPPLFSAIGGASATFRAFTPGYDVTSTDPLLQRGGLELSARMAINGLVGDGAFKFAISPPATPTGTPDFVATATVANLPALAGVQIRNAQVIVRKVANNITVEVDGRATILGVDARVRGTLASNLTGTLTVTFDGAAPNLGGFGISGGIRFTLTQGAGGLTATLGFNGQVTFPQWLSTASGQASAAASGTFSTNGNFDLQLSLANFAFGPSRAVRIVGTSGSGPATFHLLRTGGVTTMSVDGQLNLGAASGIPLLAISGTLSSSGVGTLNTQFAPTGLNLSGFLVRGGASLAFNQSAFTMSVNALVTVPGLVTNATVSGSMNQTGIQSLTVGAAALTLPPLTLTNTSASIVRTSTSPFAYALQVGTTASIPGVVNNLAISGRLNSQGFGTLNATVTSLSLLGFNLTNGAFAIVRATGGSSISAQGQVSFLGQTLNVAQANLAIGATGGITGNLTVTVPGNAPLNFGGWNVAGTFRLAFAGTTATFAIPTASVTIPGSGTATITNASLSTAGLGSITLSTGTGLHLGGASSPFVVTGAFTLSRLGSPPVVRFSATNAGVAWTGVASFTAPNFVIASNGQIDATITSTPLTLGSFSLNLGTINMHVGDNGTGAQLQLGASSVVIPGVGTFAVPAINVAVSGLFSTTLASASLNLQALDVFGRLVFERVMQGGAPVFRLAVRNTTSGVAPRVQVGQLGSVNLNEFFIASNATFNVNASVSRIGPDELSIRGASISLHKTGAGLGTIGLDVDGGALHFNGGLGNPVQLPDITIGTAATFNQTFNVSAINLGNAFRTTSASVRLQLASGVMTLSLQSPASLTALSGSVGMSLNAFTAASDGTFNGSVTGRLRMAGFTMDASVTLNVSLQGGVVRMTLPANRAVNVNLGFVIAKFSGFAESDGDYDFTGTAGFGFSVLGFSVTGTGTFHLADSGFAGSFSGSGCAPVLGCLNTTGSINSNGRLRGSINGLNYTVNL